MMSWKTNDRCHGDSPQPKRRYQSTSDCFRSQEKSSRDFHFPIPQLALFQDETVLALIPFINRKLVAATAADSRQLGAITAPLPFLQPEQPSEPERAA